jgi:phosphoserine phosphatase RsbU/P
MSSTSGPAKDGGDFAESFTLLDGSLAVGVWDSSGRGDGAAAKMRLVRAGFHAVVRANLNVAITADLLNRVLYREVAAGSMPWPFVAGFFGIVDLEARVFRYSSCGHETAILFAVGGGHRHLPPNGPLLGISENAEFREDSVPFAHGDMLVVVTDGITDARPLKSQKDFFGSGRLCSLFEQPLLKANLPASSLIRRVVAFSDGRLDDDAAVLIARFTRRPEDRNGGDVGLRRAAQREG